MKSGCDGQQVGSKRSIKLPVLKSAPDQKGGIRKSKTSRWRAISLITLYVLMIVHFIQWRLMGETISPIEPSESMFTLQNGAINAGFIFFSLAILATLIFGRFVCGWGCHIVALQDFCAWLLKKVGLKPRPFRSRVLIYVPLVAALYMFVWPTVYRYFVKLPNEPLIPAFTNHIITTEFWATFPTVAVAIPFLFICGFVTVYFLGQKGFCTYGCPYGGIFVIADKFAPGKIRVTDACNQCGHCTATCMANVQVHAEVKQYGMVIDPGCMKHMDCISVCPNDALYFGFGMPAIVGGRGPGVGAANADLEVRDADSNPKSKIQNPKSHYSLSWPEEIVAAVVFSLSLFAIWDVYQLVPMLMALGIAIVTTYLAMRSWRLLRSHDLSFYRWNLKAGGTLKRAGWLFLSFALPWVGLNAHSGYVRWHERAGAIAWDNVRVPDELALSSADPGQWLSAADRKNVTEGRDHFRAARNAGLFLNKEAVPKLAWFEYLAGDTQRGLELLGAAAENQDGQGKAISLYYRGAILNRLGRYDDALMNLDAALNAAPNLVTAREERGEALWQLGRKEQAVAVWSDAIRGNPNLPLANSFLAGAGGSTGGTSSAYEAQADRVTPNDPYFHWMLGLRLERLGMNSLAEKHFQRAIALNPQFRARRNATRDRK